MALLLQFALAVAAPLLADDDASPPRSRARALMPLLQAGHQSDLDISANAADRRESLSEKVQRIMAEASLKGVSAAIVDASHGVIWQGSFGEAFEGRPVGPSTLFQLASVSKAVTAVVIMQQVEKGLVSLDTPINQVLPFAVNHPDFPNSAITLRQLLTHSSGICDNWNVLEDTAVQNADFPVLLGESLRRYLVPGEDYYQTAGRSFCKTAPGAKNTYSNVGTALVSASGLETHVSGLFQLTPHAPRIAYVA